MDRIDSELAVKVNHGIALAELEGIDRAASYMVDASVPFNVAYRVLFYPSMRRGGDWR